ncbi:UNKNOWN [Stylonychia lemnae]|uniref:Uncharacterized protein n=1 Tax=Stylonychia lemnae TaxID=5949 RepID=A0A078ARJ3_STYLE|nr:UNKNOWN [Stylonychia lemnae]|eukprot:CDW84601.1 UNKNOWN [Stylonychia lemnae]
MKWFHQDKKRNTYEGDDNFLGLEGKRIFHYIDTLISQETKATHEKIYEFKDPEEIYQQWNEESQEETYRSEDEPDWTEMILEAQDEFMVGPFLQFT